MRRDARIHRALEIAHNHGGTDGEHHKQWVSERMAGEDGPNTYDWDTGTAP